jgi:hypothetical protein
MRDPGRDNLEIWRNEGEREQDTRTQVYMGGKVWGVEREREREKGERERKRETAGTWSQPISSRLAMRTVMGRSRFSLCHP